MSDFTEDELTVYYNDKPVLMLSGTLAKRQKITRERLAKIKGLHIQRIQIEDQLQTCRIEDRQLLVLSWTDNQFALQREWCFPEDAKFHRFWDIRGCRCAKMDNDDAYPSGYYVINSGCPIHGN